MLVTGPSEFHRAYEALWSYRETGFVVDTETTGLEMFARENPARLCSIQLAPIADPTKHFYFPFRHGEGQNLPHLYLLLLQELLKGTTWLAHNVAFDTKILMCDGFDRPRAVLDSRIASQLANENEVQTKYGRAYALKKLCAQYFGPACVQSSVDLKAELRKRKLSTADGGMGNLWRLPAEVVYQYGVDDLALCHRLHEYQLAILKKWRLESAYTQKCKAQQALIKMEQRGLPLDIEEVNRQDALLAPRMEALVAELKELAGPEININSPQQLCKWLQLPKTDKKYLSAILDANPNASPGIRKLLEYREGKKARSTYFIPFREKADADSRVHTSFNAVGARTGRYSSAGPNAQNITKGRAMYNLKQCFKASPGHLLFEADYSSLEPRVGAYFTKDPGAVEVFQKGLDYYKPIAAKMFRMNEVDITKELRDSSKSTALGVGYGMGAFKLAVTQNLKHPRLEDGTYEYHSEPVWHMAKDGSLEEVACSVVSDVYCTCEGRKLVRWFFDAVPSMQPTIKAVISTMQRNEYIRYPLSGRVRRLEKYWNPERKRQEDNAHKAWNAALQGTGADIMEAAIIAIDEQIPEQDARMLITVHDSLLFEVAEKPGWKDTCNRILHLMENTTRIDPVPLVADAKFGTCWGSLAKYDRQVI